MNSSRCAACKHLRRRCPSDCIFSPYFPSNNPRKFSYVHKIYGASNVAKILQLDRRAEAADSLYYEAYCRVKDPVYGCVGMLTVLQQQIYKVQCEIAKVRAEIATLTTDTSLTQPPQDESTFFSDQNDALNSASSYDLSAWFDLK